MGSAFSAMSSGTFRWYLCMTLLASANLWMFWIGQTWLVLQLTDGNPVMLGITSMCQLLPIIVVAGIAGAFADRFPKFVVIACGDATLGALALLLAGLVWFELAEPWHVVLIAAGAGCASAMTLPARQTLPADLVGDRHFMSAMGLASAMLGVGRVVGPLAALVLLPHWGLSGLFLCLFLTTTVTAAMYFGLQGRRQPRGHKSTIVGPRSSVSGFRYIRARPDLVAILTVMIAVCALGWNSQLMIAITVEAESPNDPAAYAALLAIFGLAGVVGTLVQARMHTPSVGGLACQVSAMAVSTMSAGLAPAGFWFSLSVGAVGFFSFQLWVAVNALFVAQVPAGLRGRVVGVVVMVTNASVAMGALVLGVLTDLAGVRITFVLSGLVMLAVLGLALLVGALVPNSHGHPLFPIVRPRLGSKPYLWRRGILPTGDSTTTTTELSSPDSSLRC